MYFSLIAKLKTQLSPKINVTAKSRELDIIKIKMSLEVNKQTEPGGLGIRRALLMLPRPFLTRQHYTLMVAGKETLQCPLPLC